MAKTAAGKALKRRFASEALSDIDALFAHSMRNFGLAEMQRYSALLDLGVQDICLQPQRLGVVSYGIGANEFFAYHLKHSNRKLSAPEKIGRPRHLIFFRVQGDVLMVSRVLHDAMDFLAQLDHSL